MNGISGIEHRRSHNPFEVGKRSVTRPNVAACASTLGCGRELLRSSNDKTSKRFPATAIAPGKSASAGRYGGYQTGKDVQPRMSLWLYRWNSCIQRALGHRVMGDCHNLFGVAERCASRPQGCRVRANVGLWPRTSSKFKRQNLEEVSSHSPPLRPEKAQRRTLWWVPNGKGVQPRMRLWLYRWNSCIQKALGHRVMGDCHNLFGVAERCASRPQGCRVRANAGLWPRTSSKFKRQNLEEVSSHSPPLRPEKAQRRTLWWVPNGKGVQPRMRLWLYRWNCHNTRRSLYRMPVRNRVFERSHP
jgi:hypothetical protein